MTDEEISMILNTYMYMDYKEADDGMTLKEILEELSSSEDCKEGGLHYGEYTVLSEAAQNPQIGELVIGNQSHLMNYDTGTSACTFMTEDGSSIYVIYRGTGDGEWPDNGVGMTAVSTIQQERALSYFEAVVEREQISEEQKLIITGHSKGGNKAQYVTMSTGYEELLDACYNIDGQGFSDAAVDNWMSSYGEEAYESRRNKITGIYGENDYVNVLGNSIVPANQIHYVKTPVKVDNFAGYHDIKYMFSSLESDPTTGELVSVFHGEKNCYVSEQGELGGYAAVLSSFLMGLEPEKRDGCAATLMQLMELGGERKTGINEEKLTLSDIGDFFGTGVLLIAESLLFTGQGQDMLSKAFLKKSFSQDMNGNITVMVDYSALLLQKQVLLKITEQLKKYQGEVENVSNKLPVFMKNNWFLNHKIKNEAEKLEKEIKEIGRFAEQLEVIAKKYMETDVKTSDEILML
ncbi:MAG: Mbeg1-like protein [Suilimivivens sp.]